MERFNSNIKTEFNSNAHRLFSLNNLFDDANTYSREARINGCNMEHLRLWRDTIIAIYREISPKLHPLQKKHIKSTFNKSKKIGKIYRIIKTEYGNRTIIDPVRFRKHWNLLNTVDSVLRKMADKLGMLLTTKESSSDVIGEY